MSIIDYATFAGRIVKGRMLRKNIPLSVGIPVTNRCNFNCIYCYGDYYNRRHRDFTTDELLRLIDELYMMGTKWITITGGEPLLRDDVDIIIDKIKQRKIICSMNSNGSLIPAKINVVKKLDAITVSLDGIGQPNDKNRGEGSFQRIMEGINCLKENRIPFDTVTVLTKNNVNDIDEIIDLARRLDFMVEFNLIQYSNLKTGSQNDFCLEDETIKKVLRKLIEYKRKGYPILYAISSREYALKWPTSYKNTFLKDIPQGFRYLKCYMGKYMCLIDGDGLVYPCSQLIGNFPALNFLEVGFAKAWENLEKNKKCKVCYAVCYNEFNQIFAMKPDVWWNTCRSTLKNLFGPPEYAILK